MLLKISLIIAILAGAATFFFAQTKVAPRIQGLEENVSSLQTQNTTLQGETQEAKEEAAKATAEREVALRNYNNATNQLAQVEQVANDQKRRADELSENLNRTLEERNEAQRELAAFRAIGTPIEQIRTQRDDLRKLQQERDVLTEELAAAARSNRQLSAELARYKGDDAEVELPAGLKGSVVAVDPKYNFVVLDIGANQGVLENGKMMVNRNGRLVAKVQISKVTPTQSVANIIPEWQRDEIMEGDQVLY